jgi:hypothetical protein
VEVTAKSEVSKVLVVVKMVEDASLVLDVETVVFAGWEAVVDSEDVLFESRSVTELFDTVFDARIAEKVVELKPLVAAVGVSLEDVSGEFAVVEWIFVGVVRDMKLFVDEISVASVDPWDECAVELFGNAAEVGVVETSAVLFVVELVVVVGAVVGMEMAVVDPTDDLMEIVSIVGWFVTDGGVEVPEVSKFLVDVERVEDSSLVLGMETVVVTGWVVVVGSEVALVASISVVELFEATVDVRISDKIVDVKGLVVAVDVSLEGVSGEFVGVGWVFVGVLPDAKLFVEISVASVDPWEECAVELFGTAADVGVVETSAALVVVKLVVVGAVVDVEMAVGDPSDDFMEVVFIVGWFVTAVGVEVTAEVSKFLVDVEMVEDSSLEFVVEIVVVPGWIVVLGSEVALVASISVLELFKTTVDVRISDKVVEVKPSIVAVEVSLEDVSGECFVVEWVFVGVVPDVKLFVVEISVASVVPWEECAVELFGNAVDAGVAEVSIVLVVVERVEHPSVVLSVATVVVPRCVAVVDSGGVLVLVESISVVEFAVSVDFVLPLLATVCV